MGQVHRSGHQRAGDFQRLRVIQQGEVGSITRIDNIEDAQRFGAAPTDLLNTAGNHRRAEQHFEIGFVYPGCNLRPCRIDRLRCAEPWRKRFAVQPDAEVGFRKRRRCVNMQLSIDQ